MNGLTTSSISINYLKATRMRNSATSLGTYPSRLFKPSSSSLVVKYAFERNKIKGKINRHINSGMVLDENQIEHLNTKYCSFDCLLDDHKKKRDDKEYHNKKKAKEKGKGNILTNPHPNLIKSEKNASRYQDYYITPKELISNELNKDELRIVHQDPTYFGFGRLGIKIGKDIERKTLGELLEEEEKWECKKIKSIIEPVTRNIYQRLSVFDIKGLNRSSLTEALSPIKGNNTQVQHSVKPFSPKIKLTKRGLASVKAFNQSMNLSPPQILNRFKQKNKHKHHHLGFQRNGSHSHCHCEHEKKINEMHDRVKKMNEYQEEYLNNNKRQFSEKVFSMKDKVMKKNSEKKLLCTTLTLLKQNYSKEKKKQLSICIPSIN